jgi:hypothetical protein
MTAIHFYPTASHLKVIGGHLLLILRTVKVLAGHFNLAWRTVALAARSLFSERAALSRACTTLSCDRGALSRVRAIDALSAAVTQLLGQAAELAKLPKLRSYLDR